MPDPQDTTDFDINVADTETPAGVPADLAAVFDQVFGGAPSTSEVPPATEETAGLKTREDGAVIDGAPGAPDIAAPPAAPDVEVPAVGSSAGTSTEEADTGAGTSTDTGTLDAAVQEATDASTDTETPATTAPPSGYTWTEGDQSQTFDDATVREGLQLLDWARRLEPQERASLSAVVEGTGIAVARDEYDQFQAWKNQQTRQQRDADLDRLDLDPEVAELLREQRDKLAQLEAAQAQPNVAQNVNANLSGTADQFDGAVREYAASRNLTYEEATQLVGEAVSYNVIPQIAEKHVVRHPLTQQPIAPADPRLVVRDALDLALVNNEAMRQAVLSRTAPPAASPMNQQQQTQQQQQQQIPAQPDPQLTAKKARAASVASAPSAATTPTPRPISQMSKQEIVQNMAADLAKASS